METPKDPGLNVVSIKTNITQFEDLPFEDQILSLYHVCRTAFQQIGDEDIEQSAVEYLKEAMLLALNPLGDIDILFEEDE